MLFPGVLSGFLSAVIIILGFFYGLRERQMYRNLWSVFTLIFLLSWSLLSWLHPSALHTSIPAGGWIPSLLIAMVFSLLLMGLVPNAVLSRKPSKTAHATYWIVIIGMCLAIVMRYSFMADSLFN